MRGDFLEWVRQRVTGAPSSAPQPQSQSHKLTPPAAEAAESPSGPEPSDQPSDQSFEFPVTERADAYLSLGGRPVPTASYLEKKRMGAAHEAFQKKWNIALD
jgi:hypothetical protein